MYVAASDWRRPVQASDKYRSGTPDLTATSTTCTCAPLSGGRIHLSIHLLRADGLRVETAVFVYNPCSLVKRRPETAEDFSLTAACWPHKHYSMPHEGRLVKLTQRRYWFEKNAMERETGDGRRSGGNLSYSTSPLNPYGGDIDSVTEICIAWLMKFSTESQT